MLGTGMQNCITCLLYTNDAIFRSSPKFALSFSAVCGDKTVEFGADSFLCSESEITFDNLRSGTHCDARLAQPGWSTPGFNDSGWRNVILADPPRGQAKLCEAEPIVITAERSPVSIKD